MAGTSGTALILRTAQESFWNSYYALPSPFDGLVYRRESSQSIDTLARLGSAPLPAELLGDKDYKIPPELSYTITNVNYDASVRVDKRLVKFQQFDVIAGLVANMGQKARAHQDYLASVLLEAGTAATGDDGQFFFDTDHRDPGSDFSATGNYQNNDLSASAASATAPTAAEARLGLRAAFAALLGFKDDRGDPAAPTMFPDPGNFIVMVHPHHASVLNQLLVAETISSAGDNDLRGTFSARYNGWFTSSSASTFYVFFAGDQHKPIVTSEAGGMTFEEEVDFDTGAPHDRLYSASWWGSVDYGNWRRAVAVTFA